MNIFEPYNETQVMPLLQMAKDSSNPSYIRMRRFNKMYDKIDSSIEIGKPQVVQKGSKLVIFASGMTVDIAIDASKRIEKKEQEEILEQKKEEESKTIKVTEFVAVGEFAVMMNVDPNEIIASCMQLGIMVTMNQRLDAETLTIVAEEFGFEVSFEKAESEENIIEEDYTLKVKNEI